MAAAPRDATSVQLVGTVVLDDDRETDSVWINNGRVYFDRPATAAEPELRIEGWAIPGLVDMHCHVGLDARGSVNNTVAQAQAVADRDSGVLLIRDAGSPSDTRWIADEPDLPTVIRAGQHIARPRRYLRNYALEIDDPNELTQAALSQSRIADGWVKLVGDWIDRSRGPDSDLAPLWTREQLRDAILAVHGDGSRVTVHTFASETIDDLLAARVDCIEHGTGILPQHVPQLVERGIPVIPTLLQIAQFDAIAAQGEPKYPLFAAHMRHMYQRRYDHVRWLYESGVTILVGTDAGGTIPHGSIARECEQLVRAGIPPAHVVAAASWRARDYLGMPQMADGQVANFVVYPRDPRRDITALSQPCAVINNGRVVSASNLP